MSSIFNFLIREHHINAQQQSTAELEPFSQEGCWTGRTGLTGDRLRREVVLRSRLSFIIFFWKMMKPKNNPSDPINPV